MNFTELKKFFNDKLEVIESNKKTILDEYSDFLNTKTSFETDFELQNHLILAYAKIERNFDEVRGINNYLLQQSSAIIKRINVHPFLEEQSRMLKLMSEIHKEAFKIESDYLNEIDANEQ